jgi:hypothetical protein
MDAVKYQADILCRNQYLSAEELPQGGGYAR